MKLVNKRAFVRPPEVAGMAWRSALNRLRQRQAAQSPLAAEAADRSATGVYPA